MGTKGLTGEARLAAARHGGEMRDPVRCGDAVRQRRGRAWPEVWLGREGATWPRGAARAQLSAGPRVGLRQGGCGWHGGREEGSGGLAEGLGPAEEGRKKRVFLLFKGTYAYIYGYINPN